VFYKCFKHVETVPFLTSSYYCKLLEYDLRISQGSVVTVLRRDGQNYKHLQHVFSGCSVPNLIKIG